MSEELFRDFKHLWEDEHGLFIESFFPFHVSWQYDENKDVFLKKHLSKEDYDEYLLIFYDGMGETSPNFGLDHRYDKEIHLKVMNLMEKRYPKLYRSLRLKEVTGLFLTEKGDYEYTFLLEKLSFLKAQQVSFDLKIQPIIRDSFNESYENWRTTRLKSR